MQITAGQLQSHLREKLAPLYLLHGDEPLLVLEAADAIRLAARAHGFDEREVLVAGPGFRWEALAQAGGNLSLFGGSKLIDLRIPTGKPGREGGEALTRHAEQAAKSGPCAQGVATLITLSQTDWATKKAAWFVKLQQAGVALELNAPPLPELPNWIAARLARQKQSAPPQALAFIAAQVEGNLLAAHQEIQKLGLLHGEGQLSLEQVEEAVLDVARYDVDKLRAALLSGDAARAAKLLDGLRGEDAAPPLVLWAMAQETRTLTQLRAAVDGGASFDGACAGLRIFGARQPAYRGALGRLPMSVLRAALLHAARIDRMIKGLARGDLWDEFLQLALRLALPGKPRKMQG